MNWLMESIGFRVHDHPLFPVPHLIYFSAFSNHSCSDSP
jgi:hypothetical protein